MKRIMTYLRPYTKRMCIGISIKFLGTVCELFLPWALARMLDDVVPRGEKPAIYLWGGVMILCTVLAVVTNIRANQRASSVARDTTLRVRHDLYERIGTLSCAQVDAIGVPSLVSRLTTDTYNVHQMIGMMQRLGVRAPILLIGGLLVTSTLDLYLTMIVVLVIPLIGLAVLVISRKGIPLFTDLQSRVDALLRVVRENLSGARVIKALSKTDYEIERFQASNAAATKQDVRANLTMNLSQPVMNILLSLGQVLVILLGAQRVAVGLSQPGRIIAFMSYFTLFTGAMMGVTRLFIIFSRASASANRIAQVLGTPEDLAVKEQGAPSPVSKAPAHIAFDGVTFSYNRNMPAVEDIRFSLERGQSLGIIGPTGSGKTTIIRLLMRLYDTNQGHITIDGRDVRTFTHEDLRHKFGVVFQNDTIFSDTIGENIRFGRELSQEQIAIAARDAQAASYIEAYSDSYDHALSAQGVNLSGGQRQRLLIARALAAKPEILILDDASSALDYKTDADLRGAIHDNFSTTTSIIITSRVSSIAHCALILYMDDGRILAKGTHEELLASCPAYRSIAKTQMGGVAHE